MEQKSKMMNCRVCGAEIAKSAKKCPQCGAKNKKPITQRKWFWAFVILFAIASFNRLTSKIGKTDRYQPTPSDTSPRTEQSASVVQETAETPAPKTEQPAADETEPEPTADTEAEEPVAEVPVVDGFFKASFALDEYMPLDADLLYEYGEYLIGEKVVTVITIKNTRKDEMQADVSTTDNFVYDLRFMFATNDIDKNVDEGDVVTVAGTVEKTTTYFGAKNVTLTDCVPIGQGETVEAIKENLSGQKEYCEQKKQEHEAGIVAQNKADRDEYIASCEDLSYSGIERNPEEYKGRRAYFSGKVIQVSEGWFDSVTLRVQESNGNIWYVTYTRTDGEARILEGDKITCYGECDGVKSYTTIAGHQVTIPHLKMEYYK